METQVIECGYTPDFFRHSNPRDCVKIIRGYKRREYEKYRVVAFGVYHIARMFIKDPKGFHPDRIQPPYDEIGLTPEERKILGTKRSKDRIKGRM